MSLNAVSLQYTHKHLHHYTTNALLSYCISGTLLDIVRSIFKVHAGCVVNVTICNNKSVKLHEKICCSRQADKSTQCCLMWSHYQQDSKTQMNNFKIDYDHFNDLVLLWLKFDKVYIQQSTWLSLRKDCGLDLDGTKSLQPCKWHPQLVIFV